MGLLRALVVVFGAAISLSQAVVIRNSTAIGSVTVSNELLGCAAEFGNLTVSFQESGGRQFGLVKFSLSSLVEKPADVQSVALHFTQVDGKSAELKGRLGVQVVHNWDPTSIDCNRLPAADDTFTAQKLSGFPWDPVFTLDVTPTIKKLLENGIHVMSFLIYPEENSGTIDISFGSASTEHKALSISPYLEIQLPDPIKQLPTFVIPATESTIAGELFEFTVQIPKSLLTAGSYELPANAMTIIVTSTRTGQDINFSFTQESVNEEQGVGIYALRFRPTVAGAVRVSSIWFGEAIELSPRTVNVVPANVDPNHCSTTFGAGFFTSHPLPRVGVETCFLLETHDIYGNNVTATELFNVEVLAGAEDKLCNSSVTNAGSGKSRICFTPADADVVSVSVTLSMGDGNDVMVHGFPIEVDCLPGPIVPYKTIVSEASHLNSVAGRLSQIIFTTYDSADHVSNPDLSSTNVIFDGPGDVSWTIELIGTEMPHTGITRVNYTTSVAGYYHMVLVENSITVGPFNITVRPADPSARRTVLVKNDNPALAGRQNSFSIVSRDSYNNPVVVGGMDLKLEITPSKSIEGAKAQSQLTDTQDGAYSVVWMAEKAGVYSIVVSQGNSSGVYIPIDGCPFDVTVYPGSMNPTKSGFVAPPPASVRAGEDLGVKVAERDSFGNQLFNFDPSAIITATLTSKKSGEITPVALIKAIGGSYSLKLDIRIIGDYLIVVRSNDTTFAETEIKVVPSSPCAFASVTVVPSTEFQVDQLAQFSVRTRDCFGNDLTEGGQDTLRAEAVHPGTPTIPCKVTDLKTGAYDLSFTPNTVGAYNIYVYLKDSPLGESPYSIAVSPGEPFGPFSYAAGKGLHSAVAGELQHIVVRARDMGKNDATTGGSNIRSFMVRHPDIYSSSDRMQDVIFNDNRDGTYSASYNMTASGDYSLLIRLDRKDILGSPFALRVEPTVIGYETSVDSAPLLQRVVAGQPILLRVDARDIFGNHKTQGGDKIVLNFTHIASNKSDIAVLTDLNNGTYKAAITLTQAGEYVMFGSPLSQRTAFTVVPSQASPFHSSISGEGARNSIAGEDTVVRLTIRDEFYNDGITGGANVSALLIPLGKVAVHEDDISVEVEDEDDGTYVITYNAKVATQYTLRIIVSTEAKVIDVVGSPTVVTVSPNVASGKYSVAEGRQTEVQAGMAIHYVLHTKDRFGNVRAKGGDAVIARLSGVGAASVTSQVRDDNTGLYYVKLIPYKVGSYYLVGFINGEKFSSENSSLTVLPGPTNATLTKAEWGDIEVEHEAGVEQQFKIHAFDSFANPTLGHDGTWDVSVNSPSETSYGNVTDSTAVYMASKAGFPKVSIKFNGKHIQGSPRTIKVLGTWTSPDRTVTTGSGLAEGTAGASAHFTVSPQDKFGNIATKGPVDIVVTDPSGFQLPIRSQDAGTFYNISYTPVLAGIHRIAIMADGNHALHSPFEALIKPAKTDASRSISYGRGLVEANAGKRASFVIVAMDGYGNMRMTGGDRIRISVHLNKELANVSSEVQDLGVGDYIVSYIGPSVEVADKMVVNVYINDLLVGGRNLTVRITNTTDTSTYDCIDDCSQHGVCDKSAGICSCTKGWVGVSCSKQYFYCPLDCSAHGLCDHHTGTCKCSSQYSGDACEIDPSGASSYIIPVQPSIAVKLPSVSPPKCVPSGCSGNGNCIANNTCDCSVGYVGEGCEIRTHYSLITLDHGFILGYEIATGRLFPLQQGVADDKSCSGLSPTTAKSNILRPAQRKYVHIGSNEILELDPITNRGVLLAFDYESLSKGLLKKPKEHSIGVINTFKSRDLTYLGMNRIMISTDNSSTIYRINRQGDDILLTNLGLHKWEPKGIHGRYMYVGHDMIARYSDNGTFALFKFDRSKNEIQEPPVQTGQLTEYDVFISNSINVVPMSHDIWTSFDYKTGNFKTYYCPFNPDNSFSNCIYLNAGHITKGYRCPTTTTENKTCSALNRVECIRSKNCGYCLESKKCLEGNENGPVTGTCEANGEKLWIFTANEFTKQYVYMGQDRVLDFEPHSGRYTVWSVDRDPVNMQCRMLDDSVATGYLQNSINHKLLAAGDNIVDFDSTTGKFRIASCNSGVLVSGVKLQCNSWTEGTWLQFVNHNLFVLSTSPGAAAVVIDINPTTGEYRTWHLGTKEQLDNGIPLLSSVPVGQGTLAGLVGAEVTTVPALSTIIAQQPITSTTNFYILYNGGLKESGAPIRREMKMKTIDGKNELMQTKFASVGNASLIQYGPLGNWQYLDCFPYPAYGDIFGVQSPIHCIMRSAGSANPPLCSEKVTEQSCTEHPNCGWCSMNQKCFSGFRAGVCHKRDPTCPSAAWKYVQSNYEPGGFVSGVRELVDNQAKLAVHDCNYSLTCRGCVADLQCGWHVASKKCVAGNVFGSVDSTTYPVWSKNTDWSYMFCTGLDSCDKIKSCGDCTSASYCGWCASSNSCITATSAGPLLGSCPEEIYFDKCPSL